MKLKIIQETPRLKELGIEKGKEYEVADIVQKDYVILVPMRQKNKFQRVLIPKDEGELVE